MDSKRRLGLVLLILLAPCVACVLLAQGFPIEAALAYVNPGTGWVPWTAIGTGGPPGYPLRPIQLYCQSGATIAPCNPGSGGGGGGANGQYFFNKAGDTISSIEAACTSACTYVVTVPQTITLSASHTLSANVALEFKAGGLWTTNGAFTLTIPGNVQGTLNQHFAGTSTIAFGNSQQFAWAEWFGAVGDWNGTTGTDNTSPFNKTVGALSTGQMRIQALQYMVSGTIAINKSMVGIKGVSLSQPSSAYVVPVPPASGIYETSASADVVDVIGTNASTGNYTGNRFEDFTVFRTVAPTGTAAGINLTYNFGSVINRVCSYESVHDFYFHGVGSNGDGFFENTCAANSLGSATYYGYYLDSSSGIQNPSIRFRNNFYANATASGTTYGLYSTGTALNDLMSWNFESASSTYGVALVSAGGGTYANSDIHFYGPITDSYKQSAFYISGMGTGTTPTVEISGGESTTVFGVGGSKGIDIETSSGVSIANHQMWGNASYQIYVNGAATVAGYNRISGNTFFGFSGAGVSITGAFSYGNVVTGNIFFGSSASTEISIVNSNNNVVTANSMNGTATTAISVDSASINTLGLGLNTYEGTFTNTLSNAGFSVSYVSTGMYGIAAAPSGACGAVASGWWQIAADGSLSWCKSGNWSSLLNIQGIVSSGTKFTTSGCSISATTGGATAGTFTLGANSCTAVVTMNGASGATANNGWSCAAHDRTAPTVLIGGESASTTTTASFTIPAGAGATDVISFACTGY